VSISRPSEHPLLRRVSDDAVVCVAGGRVTTTPGNRRGHRRALTPDVVVPVHDDASVLAASVRRLHGHLDVNLSTGLDALRPLVAPLISGYSDVATGSRLASGANVARARSARSSPVPTTSCCRACSPNRFRDAQSGFEALRADVARRLVPQVHDDGWFFDTEPGRAHFSSRGDP
jgi:hypothetical protein